MHSTIVILTTLCAAVFLGCLGTAAFCVLDNCYRAFRGRAPRW